MERKPDRGQQRERDQRRHHECDRDQRGAREGGNEPSAAEGASHTEADAHKREEVERSTAAEADGGNGSELVADMGERRLEREGEDDDPGHHRWVQVRIGVACERGALGAAPRCEQLLAADGEEVEVRQPERARDDQAEDGADDDARAEPGAASSDADGNERLADRDDDDEPVALDEVPRRNAPAAVLSDQRPVGGR